MRADASSLPHRTRVNTDRIETDRIGGTELARPERTSPTRTRRAPHDESTRTLRKCRSKLSEREDQIVKDADSREIEVRIFS